MGRKPKANAIRLIAGVTLKVTEMPTAKDFQLHIFAAFAQEERRLIAVRTKAAFQAAKRLGKALGVNGRY